MKNKSNTIIAKERGNRVKLSRQLAKLTRQDMHRKYGINPNTLQSWEKGANLLSESKASILAEIFCKEGVTINQEWIINGYYNPSVYQNSTKPLSPELEDFFSIQKDFQVFEEINFFKNSSPQSLTSIITDDALLPLFNKGDYVGGLSTNKNIEKLVGEICILLLYSEELVTRKIFRHLGDGTYILGAVNPLSTLNELNYKTHKIISAAKITRHWLTG